MTFTSLTTAVRGAVKRHAAKLGHAEYLAHMAYCALVFVEGHGFYATVGGLVALLALLRLVGGVMEEVE